MALRVLMLRKNLNEAKAKLAALREAAKTFETREAELAADIEAAQTDEERGAVESAVAEFEREQAENANAIAEAETEVESLTGQIAQAEADAQERRSNGQNTGNERRDNSHMPQNAETRTRFFGMTIQQRDAFIARPEVQDFATRAREMLGQRRAVSGAELGIPDVMLDIIRDNINRYSKIVSKVRLRTIKGKARQNIMGVVPEAVWTESVATLNELTITVGQIEVDGYKVGGYVALSNNYLEDDDNIGLLQEIMDQLGQAIGYALDKAILYGSGTKMPIGIATRLAAATKPSWWGTKQGAFTDLSTSNVLTLNIASSTGTEFFASLISKLGVASSKYSNGNKIWCMSEKTHIALLAKALDFNATGALVAGMQGTMPVIGGEIIELDFIPDNTIMGGYMDMYLLVEREGANIAQSEHAKFIEDQTVFKGTARYDGKPIRGESFVIVRFDNTAPATSATFATDEANTASDG